MQTLSSLNVKGKANALLLTDDGCELMLQSHRCSRTRHGRVVEEVLMQSRSNTDILLAVLPQLLGVLGEVRGLALGIAKTNAPRLQRLAANQLLRQVLDLKVTLSLICMKQTAHEKRVHNLCRIWLKRGIQLLKSRDVK